MRLFPPTGKVGSSSGTKKLKGSSGIPRRRFWEGRWPCSSPTGFRKAIKRPGKGSGTAGSSLWPARPWKPSGSTGRATKYRWNCRLSFWESNGESHFTAIIREITARKKAERERRQIEEAQLFLLQCGYLHPDEDFFESLARYLAQSLDMDYVCIDRLEGDGLTARTMAIYFDGKFEDNVAYRLQDTPCGEVVGKTICCFPREVRHLFPRDAVLQEMLAESYVGTTLWNLAGQPIGLIAMIGRKPLADPHLAESILNLVGLRAAGELERKQALEALRQSQNGMEERVRERTTELTRANEQLKNEISARTHMQNALEESERKFRAIFNQTFQSIGLLDSEGMVLEVNQTALDYFQVNYRDSLGKPLWDLRAGNGAEANRTRLKEAVALASGGNLVRLELSTQLDKIPLEP